MRKFGTLAASLLCMAAFEASASPAAQQNHPSYQLIQYGGDQDRRDNNADRDRYEDRNRDQDRDRGRDHRWEAGDRVDHEFLERRYVIDEWSREGLSRPPRGHEWIRVGEEYMLVRVGDQKIAKVVFGDPRHQR